MVKKRISNPHHQLMHVPQDFSMHHSDCMQSSVTHQSSDEPMNSPICTVLITQSKEQPMSSNQSFQFHEQQSQQVQKEVKPNTGRVSKSQKTIQEENALMKKAIHCLDSLQSTTRNASIIPEKEKDGLDKFDEYIVSELRNVSNPQALNWVKLQIQNINYFCSVCTTTIKTSLFFPWWYNCESCLYIQQNARLCCSCMIHKLVFIYACTNSYT